MDLDGYAVGGLAVGESHEEMYRILDAVVPHLPQEKPIYLMGVGTPANILEAVDRGVDFFDCVYPSRNGATDTYTQSREREISSMRNMSWMSAPSRRGASVRRAVGIPGAYIRTS